MHSPPPDASRLAEAFQDSNPAYLKLIPREVWLRDRRARNIPWKQIEADYRESFGERASYSTLRRFLADADRRRAAWAAAGDAMIPSLSPSPAPDPTCEASPDSAPRDPGQARIEALQAELAALRSESFAREEELVAQQRELAELLQRNLALEAERDALAAQSGDFEDWPPDPAPRRGFALGLLAGMLLAALALAAWLLWSGTSLRGLAAFAEASAFGIGRQPGWLFALRRHHGILYLEAGVLAAGLLCGLGALRLCALAALVWLTYAALLRQQPLVFWILLLLTARVSGSLLYPRREFP